MAEFQPVNKTHQSKSGGLCRFGCQSRILNHRATEESVGRLLKAF